MKFDNGLILEFPTYTFLVAPGPVPGALQNPKTYSLVSPLWTALDRFELCRKAGMLPEQISLLRLDSPRQFLAYLRQIYSLGMTQLALDVQPTEPQAPITFDVMQLIYELAAIESELPDEPAGNGKPPG